MKAAAMLAEFQKLGGKWEIHERSKSKASATFEIVQIPTVHVKKDKGSDIKNS